MNKKQSGQGLVEVSLGIFLVVIVVWAACMAFRSTIDSVNMQVAAQGAQDLVNAIDPPDIEFPTDNAHLDEHGLSVNMLWESCKSNGGPSVIYHRAADNRLASPCKIGDFWYVFISEGNRAITVIKKEKMKTLEQVLKYLENSGYVP